MNPSIRVSINHAKLTATDLLTRGNVVYTGLNENPDYPHPPVSMPVLRTEIDDYSAAVTEAIDGGAKAIARRNATGETLRTTLRKLGHYVEANCNNDMTKFLSSGFQAATTARPKTRRVSESIRKIGPGPVSGQVAVTLVAVPKALVHELRWAQVTTGGTPGDWISKTVARVRPASQVTGLTPGATYVFQARAVTPSGVTDWSDSVTRICT